MAVHDIKIKQSAFEPSTLIARPGDRVRFQLAGRPDEAEVSVAGAVFEDENLFVVGPDGKEKTIRSTISPRSYRLGTKVSKAFGAEGAPADEQSGTVNGTITVIP
ncbi:MAG: hypothetical protein ACJ8AT_39200 [Hyalangium sp.]|uniref:hypothetical protein n=1 Tax=Hyalangium sp. TaxID=2028555 RepID=UPI00389ADAAE